MMPETPQRRGPHHRRAHSDTSFRFAAADVDDDDLLGFDPYDLDLSSLVADLPPASPGPPPPMASADSDDSSSSAAPPRSRPPVNHFRSLSVDSDFFDGLNLGPTTAPEGGFHRHSSSMDGSATSSFELDPSGSVDGTKKTMAPERLAELALIDPKRAKRILANRQSAARSKERKTRYTGELERKVQTLQTEATTLSAQVTLLQAMEQQAQLRNALNETLRDEVHRLKIATGQIPTANGIAFNRSLPLQYSAHQPPMHPFGSHQNLQSQQLQQQFHMPPSSTTNQVQNGQPPKSYSNFG